MSWTIWLIVEDENDGDIVRIILDKKRINVGRPRILKPSGAHGGISRLDNQLELLITTIRKDKRFRPKQDCIAVLHDWDENREQSNRRHYENIERICRKHRVKLVIARDEIEAWILADSGICEWLDLQPRNWDEHSKPSDELNRQLRKKYRMKYQASDRAKVLLHLSGDADKQSPSMKQALGHLDNAPCVSK
jgi:hypothetical protein